MTQTPAPRPSEVSVAEPGGSAVPTAMAQMFSGRIGATVISVVGVAVLGRLVTESEFGVFGFGLAAYGVGQVLSEFGLVHYLVRSDDGSREELASANGLSLTLAVATASIGLVIVVVAEAVTGLPAGAIAVAGLFGAAVVADAVAMPYQAMRQRSIEFRLIAVLGVAQAGVDVAVAVSLAAIGFGPVALAAGFFGSHAVAAALLRQACPAADRVVPSHRGWGRFGRFGSGFAVARFLPRAGDLVVVSTIGSLLGVRTVGLFNRAGALYAIPDRTLFQAINPVIFPALARSLKGRASPAKVYLDKVDYLAAVCWPAFAAIAVLADPLVRVVLGERWVDSVDAVRILALAGLFAPFTKMSMKLFVAMDRLSTHLRVQTVYVVATVVGVAVGALFSLEAVCLGVLVAQMVQAVGVWIGVARASDEPLRMPWAAVSRSVLLTAATLTGPAAALWWGRDLPELVQLVLATVIGAVAWFATLVVMRHRLVDDVRGIVSTKGN